MEQQLLGYEETLYRLDQAKYIAERLDRMAPWILRTRQNSMTRPLELIRPYLRQARWLGVAPSGRTIENLCQQLLGTILGPDDRQSQTKWTVKLTWFHNTVCRELEQDATAERLLRYTRGYIMQLIGLPLLEDLETCGGLSWDSAVLAWLYHQMCRATEHGQRNLGGCISLLLS
ncbi:hypothetical protein Ahy_B01g051993 [Arachis hypogaea]|uniref:Aminotransferase-like plant mobile domain-containing protein n=1 Tax=Arachis hypogaea TaxID=3818 RepID=A0A445ANA8_ARAHY|nr:hypothetical protein Ahy_B01g051993 [Arachis hypogaea]